MIYKGKIVMLTTSWASGLGVLVVDDKKRGKVPVPCERAQTERALACAFGDSDGPAGKDIYYRIDEYGILLDFHPSEDAPPEIVRQYEEAIP